MGEFILMNADLTTELLNVELQCIQPQTKFKIHEQSHLELECYQISHITSYSVHLEVTFILFAIISSVQ